MEARHLCPHLWLSGSFILLEGTQIRHWPKSLLFVDSRKKKTSQDRICSQMTGRLQPGAEATIGWGPPWHSGDHDFRGPPCRTEVESMFKETHLDQLPSGTHLLCSHHPLLKPEAHVRIPKMDLGCWSGTWAYRGCWNSGFRPKRAELFIDCLCPISLPWW